MEENNKKGIGVVVVLIIIVIGLLVALIFSVNTMININKANKPIETPNESVNNNDENENKEEVKDDEKDEQEETVEPYKNYKDIKWSDKSVDTNKGHKIVVTDNKIYINNKKVLNDLEVEKIEVYKATMSVDPSDPGYPVLVILTIDGKVYEAHLLNLNNNFSNIETTQIMKKYNVIDMTYIDNYTGKYIYFLTEDGKLIDKNGLDYVKYPFVKSGFVGNGYIPFDKNNYGYYYNSKNNTYTVIVSKSTGAKLAFSKVYEVEDGEKLLVQTAYNKLFEYDGKSNKAVQVGGTVKSVNLLDNSNKLLIIFTDGTTKVYDGFNSAWDINKDEEIQSLPGFDPYANYKNITWKSTDVINSGSISYKIENGIVNYYNSGKKTKVTGITGTAKKMYSAKNTGGAFSCYVLVDEGVIYNIYDFQKAATKVVNLSKYNIIDITEINNYTNETIYYLTTDGKLIDKNGVSYDKYGFVSSFGGRGTDFAETIPFDKNNIGYYYNSKNNTYTAIVDKTSGEKIKISEIWSFSGTMLIFTTDNKVFEYDGKSNKATEIINRVKGEILEKTDAIEVIFYFENGTTRKYENGQYGYDVLFKETYNLFERYQESKELPNKINEAVLKSNEAELKSAVAIAYVEAYAEYLEAQQSGKTPQPITAERILEEKIVSEALAIANNNSQGIKYEILVDANGAKVQKKDKNGNIIE